MTEKRYRIDDAGTLIDMHTRETYDYVSDVCELLNNLNDENEQLKQHIQTLQKQIKRLENDNIQTYTLIKEALANDRTQLGQSVLKQLLEAIQ